jgi:hypothetical protein
MFYYRIAIALDWIQNMAFRGRIRWPLRLVDWLWDKQATPYIPSSEPRV